jgi:hypothetical protein
MENYIYSLLWLINVLICKYFKIFDWWISRFGHISRLLASIMSCQISNVSFDVNLASGITLV